MRNGIGTLVLDARREGSEEAKGYTFPALVATEKTIREKPESARAAIKAVKAAQNALREDPGRATEVGRKLFPPTEAGLIAELIRRDAPFYDPAISRRAWQSMNRFARDLGLLSEARSLRGGGMDKAERQGRHRHRRRQRHRQGARPSPRGRWRRGRHRRYPEIRRGGRRDRQGDRRAHARPASRCHQ